MVEGAPDIDNVVYMDEYPHIEERLRLRRLSLVRSVGNAAVFVLPLPINYRELMEEAPGEPS
ncbi:hypothetical protein KDA23_07950 [Candidatus Saccharibacteria bacterium]|nr:hypothetical protein [Candidatus Saccharibacteria bacterium]